MKTVKLIIALIDLWHHRYKSGTLKEYIYGWNFNKV